MDEQLTNDETIANGEHMNLDAMDDALNAEIMAGAPNPTGFIESRPSAKMNPYMTEEDQGMDMTPKVFGPPQYGSPNPESAAGRLTTLEDGHPLDGIGGETEISEDYAADLGDAPSAGSDTVDEIDATDGAKELAAANDVDLDEVVGTLNDAGRISKDDVQMYMDVKELATENDVDLSTVTGTGTNGQVTVEDVQTVIDAANND